MTTMIVTAHGTKLTESEIQYRALLIKDSHSVYCPISHKVLAVTRGEIIYINGQDYFISDDGVSILIKIFGDKFIKDRIITYD